MPAPNAPPPGPTAIERVLDALPFAVGVVDARALRVQYENPPMVALYGARRPAADLAQRAGGLQVLRADGSALPYDDWPLVQVLRTGQAARGRELLLHLANDERVPVRVSAVPLHDAEHRVEQVVVSVEDLREQRRSERVLREGESLKAYLLSLSEALRHTADAEQIHATVTRIAMDHFHADRCYYCEVIDGQAWIRRDASRAGLPSVAGRYAMADFPLFKAVIDAGQPVVVHDAQTSPVLDEPLRALCLNLQVISFIDVPVIKHGQPVGILCITRCQPHEWTAHDIDLAIETAERTWSAVERGQAERVLREATRHADVSARQDAEAALATANAQLRESDRRKDEFLAMLGHELRNPLATVCNVTEAIKRTVPLDHRMQRLMEMLERQANQMSHLVDGLIEVSRVARGKIRLERAPLDLREVLATTRQDRLGEASAAGITLTVDVPYLPLWADADRVRLVQVLGNLVGNALKFTPRGGTVALTLASRGGQALITVRDSGMGIVPEAIERLFEPFEQGQMGEGVSPGGLGLGLALAKGLVELHGGQITAHSDGPGRGSVFTATLPLCAPPPDLPSPSTVSTDEAVVAPRRRILVVDDDPDVTASMRCLLEVLGHEVASAGSGPEALQALAAQRADLVLCDIGMPGMNGFEVVRSIRADPALRATAVVALSGYGQAEDRQRSTAAGFDAHLVKPIQVGQLDELLASLSPAPVPDRP